MAGLTITYRQGRRSQVDVAKICKKLMNVIDWQLTRRGVYMLPDVSAELDRDIREALLRAVAAADRARAARFDRRESGEDLA